MSQPNDAARDSISLLIPVSPGVNARVEVPQPMTHAEWVQFSRVMEAMRFGLVEPVGAGQPNVIESGA